MKITLWHGGRNLEYSYKEYHNINTGRWEHGVGLYATTHYETARKYSKGSGKTYQITLDFDPLRNISDTYIPIKDILDFLSTHVKKKHIKDISQDIKNHMQRTNRHDFFNAEVFQNLLINYDAVAPSKTSEINKFFVSHHIQYGLVKNFSGRDETVVVIYDRDIIEKVLPISAKDVLLDDYEMKIPDSSYKSFHIAEIKSTPKM